jgi:hypothetical protein
LEISGIASKRQDAGRTSPTHVHRTCHEERQGSKSHRGQGCVRWLTEGINAET